MMQVPIMQYLCTGSCGLMCHYLQGGSGDNLETDDQCPDAKAHEKKAEDCEP